MKKAIASLIIIFTFVFGMVSNCEVIFSSLPSSSSNQILTNSFDRTTWWWTDTVVLSLDSTGHSYSPEIAVDSEDNIHVVWYDWTDLLGSGGDVDIFYRMWDTVTKTWSTIEIVSTESTSTSYAPDLTIDSEDNIHVVWHDMTDYLGSDTDFDIFYRKLDANTSIWGTTEVVSTASTSFSYNPTIVVDVSENIYVAWRDNTDDDAEGDTDIYYRKKDAGTDTWGTVADISAGSDQGSFYPSLAIDSSGDVHIAWIDNANYDLDVDSDVIYRYLDSVTETWSSAEVLSTFGVALTEYVHLVVDIDDILHVAWCDQADYQGSGAGEHDVFYKYKLSSTDIWSATELATPQSSASSRDVQLVVDLAGFVHIVYRDATEIFESGTDYDNLYSYRDPITDSWSSMQVISSESSDNSWDPSIDVDKKGYVHIVWHDDTDYDSAGIDVDVFYKKLVGPPQVPQLLSINPNPSTTGIIDIYWSNSVGSENFHLYREKTPITSLIGLSAYNITTESFYTDIITEDGTYFYVVVAENDYGYSSLSNMEYVQIDVSLGSNLFSFISNELLIVMGILLGTQIIFFVLTILIKRKK